MQPLDRLTILELAGALTKFFPEDVLPMIDAGLEKHSTLVGLLDDEMVGFLIYMVRDSQTAEILWMGIKEEYHGLGLGGMMLETLEQLLGRKGVTRLIASTLSYTVEYKPFEKVRAFYYQKGFKSLGIQNDYYEDGVDRLVLLKRIP